MKTILYNLLIITSFLSCTAVTQTVQAQEKKPNVIFIFSDDQRFNSLSMTGDPIIQTPNIDELAKEVKKG